jgi:hypothetical protein
MTFQTQAEMDRNARKWLVILLGGVLAFGAIAFAIMFSEALVSQWTTPR